MSATLTEQINSALAQFSSATRLYALKVGDAGADLGAGGLLVEAFAADHEVQGIGGRDVIVVSTNARSPGFNTSRRTRVRLCNRSRNMRSPNLLRWQN